jgi:hypothetical protein
MSDIDEASTAAASTHSFRAAHAGTDRVARIVSSSQGRDVDLGMDIWWTKGTRKIHVSAKEQLLVIGLKYFASIVRAIRAGALRQSGVEASGFINPKRKDKNAPKSRLGRCGGRNHFHGGLRR